jgi:hypothetical protein
MISLWRAHVDELLTQHGITATWDDVRPRAEGRRVWLPTIVDGGTYAICLHEIGHVQAGRCPGTDPHFRETRMAHSYGCQACEVEATSYAMQHARPALTRAMHDMLALGLRSYRSATRGWPDAKRRLDRLASNIGRCGEQQRRLNSQVDVARARLAWAMLPAHQRLDLQIAEQRSRRQRMRESAQHTRTERIVMTTRFERAEVGTPRHVGMALRAMKNISAGILCARCRTERAQSLVGGRSVCRPCGETLRLDKKVADMREVRARMGRRTA